MSAILVAIGLAPISVGSSRATSRHVHVQARSYDYSPPMIEVQRGDRVTIELESSDAAHGLRIDGYDLEVQSIPGQPALLTFVADWPGVFAFRCSVTCGPLHPFMIGRLRVAPETGLWRVGALAVVATILGASVGGRRNATASRRPTAAT